MHITESQSLALSWDVPPISPLQSLLFCPSVLFCKHEKSWSQNTEQPKKPYFSAVVSTADGKKKVYSFIFPNCVWICECCKKPQMSARLLLPQVVGQSCEKAAQHAASGLHRVQGFYLFIRLHFRFRWDALTCRDRVAPVKKAITLNPQHIEKIKIYWNVLLYRSVKSVQISEKVEMKVLVLVYLISCVEFKPQQIVTSQSLLWTLFVVRFALHVQLTCCDCSFLAFGSALKWSKWSLSILCTTLYPFSWNWIRTLQTCKPKRYQIQIVHTSSSAVPVNWSALSPLPTLMRHRVGDVSRHVDIAQCLKRDNFCTVAL